MLHLELLIFLLQPSPEELYLKPGICSVYCTWKNSMSWRNILSRSLNHSMFDSLFCVKLISYACEKDKLPVNPELEQDLLLQLDPSKSMGPDGIHPSVLRELDAVITRHLSMILESWESGEVQVYWKLANIAPVFKKGKKRMTMQTTGLSVSLQCPIKSWRRFGKAFDTISDSIPLEKMPSTQLGKHITAVGLSTSSLMTRTQDWKQHQVSLLY